MGTGLCIRALSTGLLSLLAWQGAAAAQDKEVLVARRMEFAERENELVVTASFRELLQGKERDLRSGLPTTIVLRVYVYQSGIDLPISLRLASVKVVYDLWEDIFLVRTEAPQGQRTVKLAVVAEALRAATTLENFPIAPLAKIAIGKKYFVAVVAELNPLSPALLAEVRGWLHKPTSDRDLGVSSAFFGSFVSIFSNPKLPPAEAVLRLRSQPFFRVPR